MASVVFTPFGLLLVRAAGHLLDRPEASRRRRRRPEGHEDAHSWLTSARLRHSTPRAVSGRLPAVTRLPPTFFRPLPRRRAQISRHWRCTAPARPRRTSPASPFPRRESGPAAA